MPSSKLSSNTTILENVVVQYGALGLLVSLLLLAIYLLYRIIRNKDKTHKGEWEKLRQEQRQDREIFEKRYDERTEAFIKAVNDSAAKFATVMEGALKDNNQFLAKNEVVLNNCQK